VLSGPQVILFVGSVPFGAMWVSPVPACRLALKERLLLIELRLVWKATTHVHHPWIHPHGPHAHPHVHIAAHRIHHTRPASTHISASSPIRLHPAAHSVVHHSPTTVKVVAVVEAVHSSKALGSSNWIHLTHWIHRAARITTPIVPTRIHTAVTTARIVLAASVAAKVAREIVAALKALSRVAKAAFS